MQIIPSIIFPDFLLVDVQYFNFILLKRNDNFEWYVSISLLAKFLVRLPIGISSFLLTTKLQSDSFPSPYYTNSYVCSIYTVHANTHTYNCVNIHMFVQKYTYIFSCKSNILITCIYMHIYSFHFFFRMHTHPLSIHFVSSSSFPTGKFLESIYILSLAFAVKTN